MVLQLERQYRQPLLALGLPESLHTRAIEKLLNVSFDECDGNS